MQWGKGTFSQSVLEYLEMRATRIKQYPPSSLQETCALKVFVAICCGDL